MKLRNRRFIILLVGLLLFSVSAGGFYFYRLRRINDHYVSIRSDGLKAAAAGDLARAVDLLGEYLGHNPDDVEILAEYSKDSPLVERPNNEHLAHAMWALRHLLRIEPQRTEARLQLMRLYASTGYHAEALDSADIILTAHLDNAATPTELQALGLQSDASALPHDDAEILALRARLVKSLRSYPDAVEVIAARFRSLVALREYPEALQACSLWIEIAPSDIEPALLRIDLLQDNHRSQQNAMELANKWISDNAATAKNAGVADGELLIGHTYLVYGFINEARVALTTVASADPSSRLAMRVLVGDLNAVRETELARTVLARLLKKEPSDDSIRFELVSRDWETAHLTEVVDLLKDREKDPKVPCNILALRTIALLMLKRNADAQDAIQPLAQRHNDPDAAAWVVILKQLMAAHSDPQIAIDACGPALEQSPDDAYLRHFMADAYLRLGEREMAAREWRRVVEQNLSWVTPAMRLTSVLLDAGRTDPARQAALEAARRAPNSLEVGVALAEAWTANIEGGHQENSDQCMSIVDRLCDLMKTDDRPRVLKARLLAAMGQPQHAADSITRALNSPEKMSEASWLRLASLSEARHLGLEQACIARSQKEFGITPRLAYAKAAALFTTGDPKGGLAAFDADAAASQQAVATQPALVALALSNDGDQHAGQDETVLGWDLARASYLELIQAASAAPAWAKLADANPNEMRVQQLVLSVRSVQLDKEVAARCIDRIGEMSGHASTLWRTARARWLVAFGASPANADEARTLLDDLVREIPDATDVRVLSAQAYEHAGKLNDAVGDLRAATNLSPGMVSIRLYLARLLEMQGDFDSVREELDHFTDADLQATDQRQQAAALLAQQGQLDRAIALLEEDARTGAEARTASLLLAELYQRRNDFPKAEAIFDKLMAAKPDAAVLHFGADLLASQGRLDEAHKVLSRLDDTARSTPGITELIRADFELRYESADGPDKAIALFQAATKAAPSNPLTWRALTAANLLFGRPEQALAAVSAGLSAIPDDPTLSGISRQPAMLTYAAQNAELKPLLLFFVKDPSAGSAAASSLEAIYAAYASEQPLDSLAVRLNELVAQNPRFAPLPVYLVRLYSRLRRFDDAVNVATEAAHSLPESSEVNRAASDILLYTERWPEALAAANRWRDNVPNDRIDADLAAGKALLAMRQPLEVIDRLRPYVTAQSTNPDGHVLEMYGEAQRAAGITPDLAALMQPLLDRNASGRAQWMQFAVSNLPPAEAEGWLRRASEKMADKATPEGVREQITLAQMYGSLALRDPGRGYAQIARQILTPLANMPNPSPLVLVGLASRLETDGDLQGAELNYRHAIAIQPRDPLALNNLAMLLARRGRPSDAVQFVNAALKLMPEAPELYDTRAFVLEASGSTEAALSDIRQAVRLDPAEPRYRLRLVEMLDSANRSREATDELKSLEAMPYDKDSLSPEQSRQLAQLHKRLLTLASAQN